MTSGVTVSHVNWTVRRAADQQLVFTYPASWGGLGSGPGAEIPDNSMLGKPQKCLSTASFIIPQCVEEAFTWDEGN